MQILLPNGYTVVTGYFQRVHEEFIKVGNSKKRVIYATGEKESLDGLNCLQLNLFGLDLRLGNLSKEQMKEVISLSFETDKVNLMNPKFSFSFDVYTDKKQLAGVSSPYLYYKFKTGQGVQNLFNDEPHYIFEDDEEGDID